jgi:hypothetical protein
MFNRARSERAAHPMRIRGFFDEAEIAQPAKCLADRTAADPEGIGGLGFVDPEMAERNPDRHRRFEIVINTLAGGRQRERRGRLVEAERCFG